MSQATEKTMRCPFDPSHVMPYDRFLNHLEKCKFPDKHNYLKCRFNPYHVFHKESITSHQTKCPDRAKYDPIQDDEKDWWGAQEEQKPEKSTVSTSVTVQSSKISQSNNSKFQEPQFQKIIKKGNVVIEDFDSKDFSAGKK